MHKYFSEMQGGVNIPMLSIIDETVNVLRTQNISKTLILATPFTIQQKLYQIKLSRNQIEAIVPSDEEQALIFEAILSVLKRGPSRKYREAVSSIINRYLNTADGVILGCTELPILLRDVKMRMPLFDTLQILADAVYNYSISHQTL